MGKYVLAQPLSEKNSTVQHKTNYQQWQKRDMMATQKNLPGKESLQTRFGQETN